MCRAPSDPAVFMKRTTPGAPPSATSATGRTSARDSRVAPPAAQGTRGGGCEHGRPCDGRPAVPPEPAVALDARDLVRGRPDLAAELDSDPARQPQAHQPSQDQRRRPVGADPGAGGHEAVDQRQDDRVRDQVGHRVALEPRHHEKFARHEQQVGPEACERQQQARAGRRDEAGLQGGRRHPDAPQLRERHQAARHRALRPAAKVVRGVLELVRNPQLQETAGGRPRTRRPRAPHPSAPSPRPPAWRRSSPRSTRPP